MHGDGGRPAAPAGGTVAGATGDDIESRKREHIEIVLDRDVAAKGVTTGFEQYAFEHNALPELDLDEIDLSIEVFGHRLAAPFLISSMTGGTEAAREINLRLAEAAQELGLAMGVGSQRAALQSPAFEDSFQVRPVAPDILLFANLGAVQLNYGFGVDEARRAVDMIGADALFLHLNPLQEAVQKEGNRNWSGLLEQIEALVRALDVPVVAKEIGNGISAGVARKLERAGVAAIDIAGAGGTSWSEVEAERHPDVCARTVARAFAGWGIPTSTALVETVEAVPALPVFASGGIRSGIDAAKALRLGAGLVGMAAPMLKTVTRTAEAAAGQLQTTIRELQITMFCTGSRDLGALREARLYRQGRECGR